ncbi:hypothetical protein [Streptomyces sp. NPDC057580]|uniref:hypothetical protein n=1 Tax=Streptomyces sp. NPDC057580 TaxID=3346173 RepID=UPI0036CBEB8D
MALQRLAPADIASHRPAPARTRAAALCRSDKKQVGEAPSIGTDGELLAEDEKTVFALCEFAYRAGQERPGPLGLLLGMTGRASAAPCMDGPAPTGPIFGCGGPWGLPY